MSLVDNTISKDDYLHSNNFCWFTGVIEDIHDPEQRGRCKVRCFGYHTERKNYISTAQLPWAHVMMPVTSASQCGVGESATGLLRGSWVVGFFRDGPSAQDPIIMGSLPSKTTKVDYEFGFCDPSKEYPYTDKIDDPDTPEEAVSKDMMYAESFSYKKKEEHRNLAPVTIAMGGVWELPPVPVVIKVEYPKNHVKAWERKVPITPTPNETVPSTGILEITPEIFSSAAGISPEKEMHVQEFDVTPGFERISTMHSCGTYQEWTADGEEHVVIESNERRIVKENQHIYVMGDCTLTVDGNLHTLVEGDQFTHIRGNRIELIEGDLVQTVQRNVTRVTQMNNLNTIGMNYTRQVSMNSMLTTSLLKSDFVGVSSVEVTGVSKNVVAMANHSITTMGAMTTTVAGMRLDSTMGPAVSVALARNNFAMTSTMDISGTNHMQVATGNITLASGGPLLNMAAAGQHNIGAPFTINTKLPFLMP